MNTVHCLIKITRKRFTPGMVVLSDDYEDLYSGLRYEEPMELFNDPDPYFKPVDDKLNFGDDGCNTECIKPFYWLSIQGISDQPLPWTGEATPLDQEASDMGWDEVISEDDLKRIHAWLSAGEQKWTDLEGNVPTEFMIYTVWSYSYGTNYNYEGYKDIWSEWELMGLWDASKLSIKDAEENAR